MVAHSFAQCIVCERDVLHTTFTQGSFESFESYKAANPVGSWLGDADSIEKRVMTMHVLYLLLIDNNYCPF